MTPERFEGLVQSCEALAAKSPLGYKLRVIGLAALGYGYILLVLLSSLAAAGLVIVAVIAAERGTVTAGDTFLPLALSPEEMHQYRDAVQRESKVARAWLVAKEIKSDPGKPGRVLMVAPGWFRKIDTATLQRILQGLPNTHSHVVMTKKGHEAVLRRVKAVPGAQFY